MKKVELLIATSALHLLFPRVPTSRLSSVFSLIVRSLVLLATKKIWAGHISLNRHHEARTVSLQLC
jgi:hypothetical protein